MPDYMMPIGNGNGSISAGSYTTNAAANTITAGRGIIAAPGVGFAIRVVAIHVASFRNNTGKINALFHDSAAGTVLFRAALPAGGNDAMPIPSPGVQLPQNTGLQVDDISDLASQSWYWTIYYYVDVMT